jgi:hypothetical protein
MATIEEKVNVINIETKKAESSVQSLKTKIKQLKDEMGLLEEGTEEYNEKARELGSLMNQQAKITENAKFSTADLGENLSNVTQVLNGGVGAVTGFTSALALMGVEMDDDTKLQQKLVQAIALMSSLSAIDNAINAFNGLKNQIKQTTLAQKGLNAAMKANPIGFLITAVATLVTVFVTLKNLLDDTKDRLEAIGEAARQANGEYEFLVKGQEQQIAIMQAQEKSENELNEARIKFHRDNMNRLFGQIVQYQRLYNLTNEQLEEEENYQKLLANHNKEKEEYEKALWNREVIREKQKTAARKREEEATKRQRDAAKARLEELKKEKATWEDLAKLQIEREKSDGKINEIEYQEKLLNIEVKKLNAIREQDKKKGKDYISKSYVEQEKAVRALITTIDDLRKTEKEEAEERRKELVEGDLTKAQLEYESEYYNAKKKIYEDYANDVNIINEQLYLLEQDKLKQSLQDLEQQLSDKLISLEEYKAKKSEIEYTISENERNESERRKTVKKEEAEQKLTTEELLRQQIIDLQSGVSGLLSGIGENLSQDTEAYKNIKAAEAIINTLSAAVAAFSGITSSTGGWGIAAAIAQAAAVTATGMATVKKIYAVNTNGSSNNTDGSMTTSAMNVINRNYTNARLTDSNGSEVNIGDLANQINDKKVYVSVKDINEAQTKVKVVYRNNSF